MSDPASGQRPLLFLGTSNLDVVCFCETLPERFESVMGSIERFPGGKGANQAVCAGRLGGRPLFATLLGDDDAGAELRRSFSEAGVRCEAVIEIAGGTSGMALIFVEGKGDNIIGIDPGTNLRFGPDHVERALALVPDGAVLVAEMGLPMAALRQLFQRKGERFLIFNPAPVTGPLSPEDCAAIDLLTPNELEAEALTGVRIGSLADALAAAGELVARGCGGVIVTLGRQGAVYSDGRSAETFQAFPVEAVDTTAAGDAFNGGLAHAIASGQPMASAIRYAMAVAALSVTKKGAQSSMPGAHQVADFLAGDGQSA